jgi:hypothetical protein
MFFNDFAKNAFPALGSKRNCLGMPFFTAPATYPTGPGAD